MLSDAEWGAGPGHYAPHRAGAQRPGRRGGALGRGPARSGSRPRRGHAGRPGRNTPAALERLLPGAGGLPGGRGTPRSPPHRASGPDCGTPPHPRGAGEGPPERSIRGAPDHAPPRRQHRGRRSRQRRRSSSLASGTPVCWSASGTAAATGTRSPVTRSRSRATRHGAGGPVWFGGAKLAADLSLPKLRARWRGTPAGPWFSDPLTAAERNAIWEHAARAAEHARDEIRCCAATDPAAASDAAWAASDTLHAAASALRSRELRRAADSYARAARIPYGRTSRVTPAGASLRQAARLLSRAAFASQDNTAALAALILQLAALVETVIELRQVQRHAAQASAARCSARHLRALGRRLNRRWESRAGKVARLTAESFPIPPRAENRASGWHEPAASAGPRPRHGTGPPRQRGPSR